MTPTRYRTNSLCDITSQLNIIKPFAHFIYSNVNLGNQLNKGNGACEMSDVVKVQEKLKETEAVSKINKISVEN